MDTVIDQFGEITQTVGPNGEEPTPSTELVLTEEEKEQIRAGGYRAAISWHELSNYSQALQAGIEEVFEDLNIEVVAVTDAGFDAAVQADQILSALALEPDVILGLAADPTTARSAYAPAVDQGVKLIFADQAPDGMEHGSEFQAVFIGDLFKIGQSSARALGDALGGEGEIGVIFYDAQFHVTNFRDAAFLSTMASEYPGIEIVAKQGFADPNRAEEIANAMLTRNPNIAGIYASWAVPAQGALAALKNAGNTTVKIVTIDLDDTIAADMAADGHVAAIITYPANVYGRSMGTAAALALLGKEGPEFGVIEPIVVTKDTLTDGYEAWNQEVPGPVQDALDN
jgi:ribose transport system substrate-binding protein